MRAIDAVRSGAQRAGVSFEIAATRCPRDATRIVQEHLREDAGAYDAVLTVGGDGTAMEAATALAGIPGAPPLGIIGAGTANVLARTLGISMSVPRAVDDLLHGDIVPIDIGRVVGGPAFAIGLGVGLDAAMIWGASSVLKRRIGYAAYILSALRAGLRLERFTARVTIDGVVHQAETSSVLVANFGTVLGDLLCFGEGTGPQDGLLDVCLYSPHSLIDAARIFYRMLFGGVGTDRCVRILRGRHVIVECDPPRPMQADGELLGVTPVEIRVEPAALRLLVPTSRARAWPYRRLHTVALRPALAGSPS